MYSSADGGRHWQRAALPASRDSSYELPAVFGSTVLAPVLSCAHHVRTVRIYRRDAAGIWSSPESSWQLPGLPAPRFGCGQFSVAMPSRQVAWAVAFGGRTAVVGRTVDGRHWARAADPAPSASFATIHATDARHAWVLADGRAYVTADGGKSWRRVRVP